MYKADRPEPCARVGPGTGLPKMALDHAQELLPEIRPHAHLRISAQSLGHELAAFQKLSDDPLKECQNCGNLEHNKLVSAAGFRLKGGGWYEIDFKGSQDKKRNIAGCEDPAKPAAATPAPAAAESSTPPSTPAKTESKPAAGGT